ncbi:isoaspartyl peptidase/L-asparaginase [Psychroflexus sp. CAK57W]|uniref:isoaspartyl peptidase/L-asparaginase family protein n=1 Tax=Psychroflexus curvus TaxID=2873595 RepID=UPI001CCC8B26|nr:isoaspartyl peptidase/L-asparaginase [Psychroflexus curvus]MBZ9787288.1 isoaspartyl peptidase/L-asparaginase [Psychroflexus curvus]
MKKSILLLISLIFIACHDSPKLSKEKDVVKAPKFGIVIHGGAGVIKKENMTDSLQEAYEAKLEEAINLGHKILSEGGTALEAVKETINVMENSPLFNSGKGAVLNADGIAELDASVMDGKTKNAGAVSGVQHIKNPINLALKVMNESDHVMLSATGAEEFAKLHGLEFVENSYFITERRRKALESSKAREQGVSSNEFYLSNEKYGTVGCAALDKDGNLAAGTSTGGMTNKKYGRIGDSPIIGAGTYANNKTCAISATGHGEYFIRGVVAHDISAMMEYQGISLEKAAQRVIQNKLTELGGTGGIIGIDKKGNVVMEFNTPGMFRAAKNMKGETEIKMYKD